jgi:outer membrane protein assembly factor BamB
MTNRILILLLLTLTSCSGDGWFGIDNSDPKLPGKRIAILKSDDISVANTQTEKLPITIPDQQAINIWANSNGSQYNYPANIKLDEVADKYKEVRAFSFSSKNSYLTATPVITENNIFVLNGSGILFSYDKNNLNKLLWKKNLALADEKLSSVGGGMVYHNGILYVTSGGKDVVALSGENGKEIWRHTLDNALRSAPIIQGDKLFVSTIDNKVYFLELNNGNTLWVNDGASETIGLFGSASIAVDGNIVVIPHSSGQLHGVNIYTGQELWSANLSYGYSSLSGFSFSDIDVTPVIRDNIIYVAGNMGSLYAINLVDGVPLWKRDIKGVRSIWVAGDFLYVIDNNNQLLAISRSEGLVKYITKLGLDIKYSYKNRAIGPILAGDKLIIASNFGKLYIVSPFDGKIIEERSIPKHVNLLPVIIDNHIYLLNNEGNLIIL